MTGGAGFIGGHLVEALLVEGWRVRVLDDFSSGSESNLAGAQGEAEIIRADVGDLAALSGAAAGVEVVFHLAAIASVPRSVEEPLRAHAVNLGGTLTVCEAARSAGCRRVVLASSSAVYGGTGAASGDGRPEPLSPYAVQKLASEDYLAVYAGLHGLEAVSLRYFNVYGPRQDPHSDYAAVIPRFVDAALAGEPLCIHGDGAQTRDFVHVSDVARANLLAADAVGAPGARLDVGSGRGTRISDLVPALEAALGRRLEVVRGPARPGDVRESQANASPTREALNWAPGVDLDAGIRHTIDAQGGMPGKRETSQ